MEKEIENIDYKFVLFNETMHMRAMVDIPIDVVWETLLHHKDEITKIALEFPEWYAEQKTSCDKSILIMTEYYNFRLFLEREGVLGVLIQV